MVVDCTLVSKSHLRYCHSQDGGSAMKTDNIFPYVDTYHGLPEKLMRRLQSMQNTTARMITSARWRDHITPILRQLHWLPVRQRVAFKIAVLVFQCLTGHAPAYLADDCHLAADACPCSPAQPTRRSALSVARTTTSATGALQRLDHVCGTRYHST